MFQVFVLTSFVFFVGALGVPASFFLYGSYSLNHPWVECVETSKGDILYIGAHTTRGEAVRGVPLDENGHRRDERATMIVVDHLSAIGCEVESATL